MRIDLRIGYDPAIVDRSETVGTKKARNSEAASSNTDSGASELRAAGLEAKVLNSPEVRQSRVEQLQQSIASGTYAVSDEQLAQALWNNLLQR
jgi:flagellar biosynthesis anti-sigma factor FlgM